MSRKKKDIVLAVGIYNFVEDIDFAEEDNLD